MFTGWKRALRLTRWVCCGLMPAPPDDRPSYTPAFIGAWLKLRGKNDRWLARETGYSAAHIGRLIKGERPWDQKSVDKIAKALSVTGLELLYVDPSDEQSRGMLAAQITGVPADQRVAATAYLRFLAEGGPEARAAFEDEPESTDATPGRAQKKRTNGE